MIIIQAKLLFYLSMGKKNVNAMALWPFIIFKNKEISEDKIIKNHEKIHHRQQLELFIIPYYIWYFCEYTYFLFKFNFKHYPAYMNISFEKEAYANEKNLDYLKTRKFLSNRKFMN